MLHLARAFGSKWAFIIVQIMSYLPQHILHQLKMVMATRTTPYVLLLVNPMFCCMFTLLYLDMFPQIHLHESPPIDIKLVL